MISFKHNQWFSLFMHSHCLVPFEKVSFILGWHGEREGNSAVAVVEVLGMYM
jgi:hypothetical protein